MLVINSSMFAMCRVCSCADDDTSPNAVLQKVVFDDANDQQLIYQYNQPSNRWRLVQERFGFAKKSNYTVRFYLKKSDQINVYEGENGGEGKLKLVETLTVEKHNKLDLKQDGEFVTGMGQ